MTDEQSWHELFPPREDEPPNKHPPQISAIYVRKMQPNNKFDTYPLPFSPDELTSLEQVHATWGGGLYEFVARDDQRRVSRRQTERIAGVSKPWPGIVEGDDVPAPTNGQGYPHAKVVGQTGGPTWLPVLAVVAPLALDYLKFQAQAQATQQQQFQMLMTTLLDRGSNAGKEHLQAMASLYSSMPETLARVMSQGAGGGTSEAFLKGLETAKELYEGMREAQGDDGLNTDTLMQTVAGFMQFMNQQGGAPVPGAGFPGGPPPAPPAPPAGAPPDVEPN